MRNQTDKRINFIADGQCLGLAARLNQIIDVTQSGYLARLDADDIAYPERLAKQVAFLERNPDVDLVGSAALLFRKDGSIEGILDVEPGHDEIRARRWRGFRIPHPSWMGRVRWFQRYHYDPTMKRAQDQELLLRAVQTSRYACIPDILIGYRMAEAFLSKRLVGRVYLARALMTHAMTTHEYARIPLIVAELIAKCGFDSLMAIPVLGKCVAHPIGRRATPDERAQWEMLAPDVQLVERKQ